MARSHHLVCLLFGLCLVGLSSAAVSTSRQSPSSSSSATALVASGVSSVGSLGGILVPALRTLTAAPLRLLGQLLREMINFFRGRNIRELFDFSLMRQIISRLPDRALIYYQTLVDMESQCVQRTLCDLADLTSRRLPKWAEQIVLIYLNTFSENRPSYQVLINGLSTHKCPQIYSECDSEQFLARVSGNVSESISSTIAPVQAAFVELVNVTVTTLSSLAVEDAPRPVVANADRPDSNLLDPLNESEEDEPNFRQPNRFPSRGPVTNFAGPTNRMPMRPFSQPGRQ